MSTLFLGGGAASRVAGKGNLFLYRPPVIISNYRRLTDGQRKTLWERVPMICATRARYGLQMNIKRERMAGAQRRLTGIHATLDAVPPAAGPCGTAMCTVHQCLCKSKQGDCPRVFLLPCCLYGGELQQNPTKQQTRPDQTRPHHTIPCHTPHNTSACTQCSPIQHLLKHCTEYLGRIWL